MLGPGLTQLLKTLAALDHSERTPLQRHIYAELRLLYMAVSGSRDDDRRHPEAIELRQTLGMERQTIEVFGGGRSGVDLLGAILEPWEPPSPQGKTCNRCGQIFPIMTQPKS